MPKRKRSGGYGTRKRRRTSRRRRATSKLRIRKGPFPTSAVVKMRYCQSVQIDPSLANVGYTLFRANSIFDPDYSGAGHQPMGHDQWAAIYNHYSVLKSRIHVTFLPSVTSVPSGYGICGISIKDDPTVETNFESVRECRGSKWTYAIAQRNNSVTNGYNSRVMFPVSAGESSRTAAAFGANPTEDAIYQVWCRSPDPGTDPSSYNCIVTIDYTVKMWELKDLGQS